MEAADNSSDSEQLSSPDSLHVDSSGCVAARVGALYGSRLMSDVLVVVGGREYPAHRLVLGAASDVLHVMLLGRAWPDHRAPTLTLHEPAHHHHHFPAFLRYLYTGQLTLTPARALPLLLLADKYNVRELCAACARYMCGALPLAARRPRQLLLPWLHHTDGTPHQRVAHLARQHLAHNLEQVARCSAPAALAPADLAPILHLDLLVVRDEFSVWELCERALLERETDADGDGEEQAAVEGQEQAPVEGEVEVEAEVDSEQEEEREALLEGVRFERMRCEQLARLVLSPLARAPRTQRYLVERMARAMRHHATVAPAPAGAGSPPSSPPPRIYTSEPWSCTLLVDGFASVPSYHSRTVCFGGPVDRDRDRDRDRERESESESEVGAEWSAELWGKGVWFRKALMIMWGGGETHDVPESVVRTVRVSVERRCKGQGQGQGQRAGVRARVALLVWAAPPHPPHDEYVAHVITRTHTFTPDSRVVKIDDVVDFDELNRPVGATGQVRAQGAGVPGAQGTQGVQGAPCRYLLGPQRDTFKVQVVVTPLPPP